MYKHFVNKNQREFWKSWNSKFRKNVSKHVTVNGKIDDDGIANKFAFFVFYKSSYDIILSVDENNRKYSDICYKYCSL